MRRLLHTVKGKSNPIPAGYTLLQYIESTANGYVNIPYKVNYKSKIRAKYMATVARNIQIVFGVVNGTPSVSVANGFMRMLGTQNYNRVAWGGNVEGTVVNTSGFPQNLDTRYEIYYNLNKISIEGYGSVTAAPSTGWTSDLDFSLFSRRRDTNSRDYYFAGRIAYFNIEEDGVQTLNLLPVRREEDDKLGYYDTVSQTFYPCSDSGVWIAGE